MARNECNCYFSFWAIFCPFTPSPPPLTAQTSKIKKKNEKIPRNMIILHICTKNYNEMMYGFNLL